jgi:hypothetical protein
MSPGVKRPGSEADDSLHLMLRLKPTGDIPSLPLACIAHKENIVSYEKKWKEVALTYIMAALPSDNK